MGLTVALPPKWPALRVYFGIAIILSIVGWTGLARVVRGKLLDLRGGPPAVRRSAATCCRPVMCRSWSPPAPPLPAVAPVARRD